MMKIKVLLGLIFLLMMSGGYFLNGCEREDIFLKGYISLWVQDCSSKPCALPRPLIINIPLEVGMTMLTCAENASGGGGADFKRIKKEFKLKEGKLLVEVSLYALCPHDEKPFFKVQTNLSGIVKAFCSSSLNRSDFVPFPVVSCAGYKGDYRIGITLHRIKFTE